MIRDSVVHEVDVARFLLDEEIASVQVIRGWPTSRAPTGDQRPDAGDLRDGVRPDRHRRGLRRGRQVGYEVRTEVVGEKGSALIGLDQNLLVKTTDGRWGGADHAQASSSGSGRRTTSSCSAGWTRPGAARSTGPAPGTDTRRSRSARPGVEAVRTGAKVDVRLVAATVDAEGPPRGPGIGRRIWKHARP